VIRFCRLQVQDDRTAPSGNVQLITITRVSKVFFRNAGGIFPKYTARAFGQKFLRLPDEVLMHSLLTVLNGGCERKGGGRPENAAIVLAQE
jgi:hypothetical protein